MGRSKSGKESSDKPVGVCSQRSCPGLTDGIHKQCDKHRAKSRELSRLSRLQPNIPGECHVARCHRAARPGFTKCEQCAASDAKYSFKASRKKRLAERRQEVRVEVLTAYGAKCECCGNAEMPFLTIDHINRYSGVGPKTGHPLYLWIKAHNFPSDFRVLCLNCNFSLGKFGYCRHSTLTQPLVIRCVQERTLKVRQYAKEHNQADKVQTFNAYGGPICNCCGETNMECLTIDHLDNKGGQHRKELNGTPIYRWLVQNNFPPGYQVLCMNCNFTKRFYGMCWHKVDKSTGLVLRK